ncbi:uncharacterized protein N7483_004263 [Penicillium malachiteum]|uniref:uncharacterized protein n=1 Tax=Penicillium malachiteum TaxID=1324776 RepID=UPI0025467E44|nr:uncharacterized protein N7483_004263 [Penicillium malachiteum]KAJ5729755.1 hypothetical protein N7483_004263 [Penicillium malachiteum]
MPVKSEPLTVENVESAKETTAEETVEHNKTPAAKKTVEPNETPVLECNDGNPDRDCSSLSRSTLPYRSRSPPARLSLDEVCARLTKTEELEAGE